ncbi:MAG: DUF4846 domain-containing protein [Armatimonadota bacterium]
MTARAALVLLLVMAAAVGGCRKAPPPAAEGPPPAPAEAYVAPLTAEDYPWPKQAERYEPLAARFPPPEGFERVPVAEGSWGEWLRHLPLLPAGTPVRSLDGSVVMRDNAPELAAVVDMDVREDQECAGVILRLRAEYLRHVGRGDDITFHLTDGGLTSWGVWRSGMRLRVEGDRLIFHRVAPPDDSRERFDGFLANLFAWCGTKSLAWDGRPVGSQEPAVGDFFVSGGSAGHALLIVDLARSGSGELRGLILQGFTPPQSPHILAGGEPGAWFKLSAGRPVEVPWGRFDWDELRRF